MLTVQGAVATAFACSGLTEFFQVPLPYQHEATVALLVCFCLLHSAREWGPGRAALFLALVYAAVTLAEGFAAELLFGLYVFTQDCTLGPHVLFGRPLFVPMAWYCCSYPALCIAQSLVANGLSKKVLLASLLTMANNVVVDPFMSHLGSSWWVTRVPAPEWIWNVSESTLVFQGVPLRNFCGWFLVSLVYFGSFAVLAPEALRRRVRHPRSVLGASLCIALFWTAHPRHALATRLSALLCLLVPVLAAIAQHNDSREKLR